METLARIWPYDRWREGQYDIASRVFSVIKEGRHLLLNYPTGAGKTSAVLVGALAANADGESKIVYLVRARSQFQAPLRELRRIAGRRPLKAVFLQNRRDMCLLKGVRHLPYDDFLAFCRNMASTHACPYHEAYDAAWEWSVNPVLDIESIKRLAGEKGMCPYEMAKAALKEAEVIVASYNYIFEPEIRNVFLSEAGLRLDDIILVIDEAHNLIDNIIGILSRDMRSSWIREAYREVVKFYDGGNTEQITKGLYSLYIFTRKLGKSLKGEQELERESLMEFVSDPHSLEHAAAAVEQRRGEASRLRKVASFLTRVYEGGNQYVLTAEPSEGDVVLRALCINPAHDASYVFQRIRSATLMSGTLPPAEYMVSMLGLDKSRLDELRLKLRWASNTYVCVVRGFTSRFRYRDEAMYRRMAGVIDFVFENLREGVVLAVAPSYNMAKAIRAYTRAMPLFLEREDTRLDDVVELISTCKKLLIICVAWGKLVEGIELMDEERSAVKVVVMAGLPIPEPSVLNKKLVSLLKDRVGSEAQARHLVYVVPATIRVLQAMGRSIRSEHDKGLAIILDERVLDPATRKFIESFGYSLEELTSSAQLSEYIAFVS